MSATLKCLLTVFTLSVAVAQAEEAFDRDALYDQSVKQAQTEWHAGNLDHAYSLISRATRLDPSRSRGWFIQAMISCDQGQAQNALEAVNQAVEKTKALANGEFPDKQKPVVAKILTQAAKLYYTAGDTVSGARILQNAADWGSIPAAGGVIAGLSLGQNGFSLDIEGAKKAAIGVANRDDYRSDSDEEKEIVAGASLIVASIPLEAGANITEANTAIAAGWLKRASELGNFEASTLLAGFYDFGAPGIAVNEGEATRLYQKALSQIPAMAPDAKSLRENLLGKLKPACDTQVEKVQAAETGDLKAQIYLAELCHYGFGNTNVRLSLTKAFKWYALAATQGDARAQMALAGIYKTGDVDLPPWTPSIKNLNLALEWYLKATAQGNADAAYEAGEMLSQGKDSITPDFSRAHKLFRQALKSSAWATHAAFALGALYESGLGVSANHEIAVRYYKLAYEKYQNPRARGALIRLGLLNPDGSAP